MPKKMTDKKTDNVKPKQTKAQKIEKLLGLMKKVELVDPTGGNYAKSIYGILLQSYERDHPEEKKPPITEKAFLKRFDKYFPKYKEAWSKLLNDNYDELQLEAMIFYYGSGAAKITHELTEDMSMIEIEEKFFGAIAAPFFKKNKNSGETCPADD
jgi:hypothetical protein